VAEIGKDRLVLAALWTSAYHVGPALSALEQSFEVYVTADACGDVSDEAHDPGRCLADDLAAIHAGTAT
jgi:nicotinamidase-related amidase